MKAYLTLIRLTIRRQFNKHGRFLSILLFSLTSTFLITAHANAQQPNEPIDNKNNKTLIVYYSRSGNTDFVANYIHDQIGGDIIKLETQQPYPEQYRATTVQAKKELESDYRPPLKNKIDNIADYDTVFIGSPNWWGTMSMPIRTFLYSYDLSGKKIALFITHEGSGLGRSLEDLAKFSPNATILDGIAIRGNDANKSQQQIQQWLSKIGIGN